MRRQATRTLAALGASALALALLAATVAAATRSVQVEPLAGAPGTHVHVVITDTGAARLSSPLLMYPYRSDSGCAGTAAVQDLGEVRWDGTVGTADFVVPAVPPGRYTIEESLTRTIPPCMPVAVFTVLGPDSAYAPKPQSPLTLLGIGFLVAAGLVTLSRRAWRAAGIPCRTDGTNRCLAPP
jgi:hypothetical protein